MERMPPLVAAQLNHLLTNSPLDMKVERIWSGCLDSKYNDRFTLVIPFCLGHIKWDVLYNAYYPLAAPDIMLGEDDSDFHPFILISERESEPHTSKSSLSDWNHKDPAKLMHLIHEIRELYMSYQQRSVEELDDARLKFEPSTILSRERIEVCLLRGHEKIEQVKFAIPLLDTDLNKLVNGCPWKRPQKIYLQVTFPVMRRNSSAASAPHVKLVSSPELEALFTVDDVKLPAWVDGMCMSEYLPTVENILGDQVVKAATSVNARRRFIEALSPFFGRPVEADRVFCRKATVLASSGVFTFLVHFFLSTRFPEQLPVIMLQSSQHFDSKLMPIKSTNMTEYPWSPRWSAQEMAERLHEFMVEECLDFKKLCTDMQSQQ